MKNYFSVFLLLLLFVVGCGTNALEFGSGASIIPHPVSYKQLGGGMLASDTVGNIVFSVDEGLSDNPEAYSLEVSGGVVRIVCASHSAQPLAMATLEQMVGGDGVIHNARVFDEPEYQWRGVMIDVARHFFPRDSMLKIIDILSYHKINKLHIHLTDDIGWRVQIDSYPELTRRGAWRIAKDESVPFVAFEMSAEGKKNATGGYYTKEDIRAIVEYAAERHIEVIPEIDMPGHSGAALECYPEYMCEGLKSSNVYCVGKSSTYTFIEKILGEIAEMFPSKYIHIGGDEVSYSQWEKCPDCSKIKGGGREIGNHFIAQVAMMLQKKGKTAIGWDEIVHDKLNKDIVVMSWTGWENGVKAAENGNKVIMTPLNYVYFDHYQSQNYNEPPAWGGDNSMHRVWSFPVVPFDISDSARKNILGGQANLWTENIQTIEHLEYMLLPRLSALSETMWRGERDMNHKAWNEFLQRVDTQFDRYTAKGWNYSESSATPMATQRPDSIMLSNENPTYPIYYTTDGSEPKPLDSLKYTTALKIDTITTLRAQAFRKGVAFGRELKIENLQHLAVGGKVKYLQKPSMQYLGDGEDALINDLRATKRGDDNRWVGWEKSNLSVVIDLTKTIEVSEVAVRFLQCTGNTSVILPVWVKVSVSEDNEKFKVVGHQKIAPSSELNAFIHTQEVTFNPQKAQYIKVEAGNIGTLPLGIPRGGGNAWIFSDEIIVK